MLLDDKKFTIYGHEERRKDKWWGRMHMANVKSWDDFFSSIRQHNPHFFVRCLVFRYLFEKNCTERKDLPLTSHVFEFIFWMCLLSLSFFFVLRVCMGIFAEFIQANHYYASGVISKLLVRRYLRDNTRFLFSIFRNFYFSRM